MRQVLTNSLFVAALMLVFASCGGDDEEPNNPPVINAQSFNASEAVTNADVIGAVAASDAEGDDLTFSISDNDNNLFTITAGDATTQGGQLSLNTGQALDFETAETHTIMVTVSDGQEEASATITINVVDVNENTMPTIMAQSFTVAEDIGDDMTLGNITANDAEGDDLSFSITANDNDLFEITAGGELTLATGQNLDFETATRHTVTIEVSDGMLTASADITVIVSDVFENTAPVVDAQEFEVTEDISDATIIGAVSATDAENDNLTFSIATNDNDLFEITSAGELSLVADQILDFETTTSHTITVEVSDGNLQTEAIITINVTDVDETVLTAVVSNFAGNGDFGFSDGQGVNAAFSGAIGIVAIGDGSLLIADRGNNRIRKADAGANVSTVAGQNTAGSSDGAIGIATFDGLTGMAADADGNIYVADSRNHSIRKISIDGTVSTVAGGLGPGFDDGDISVATFQSPWDIVIDQDGNLLISDSGNHSIRKFNFSTNEVTTFAGGGLSGFKDDQGNLARFNRPYGLALDATGNLFVADFSNNRIRKVDPAGNVTSFVGSGVNGFVNGMGNEARFSRPSGIDFDSDGNLFIADRDNESIRMATPSGRVITVAGTGVLGAMNGAGDVATFAVPHDVAVDANGDVFVIEQNNNFIRKIAITRN